MELPIQRSVRALGCGQQACLLQLRNACVLLKEAQEAAGRMHNTRPCLRHLISLLSWSRGAKGLGVVLMDVWMNVDNLVLLRSTLSFSAKDGLAAL